MVASQEFWRLIINDFQPVGPVRPEHVKRFFVDRYEDDPTQSLLQQLKSNFLNRLGQPKPYQVLLTGHVGSGKSSELMRLGEELAEAFFVVWFDAESTLDESTANHFDVLLAMGLAVHKAALVAELNPSNQLPDKLVKSLAKFVRKYESRKGFTLKVDQLLKQIAAMAIGAGAGILAGPATAAAGAVAGLLVATKLELNVRDELVKTLELPVNRQEVIGALNEIIAWVHQKDGRPVLIITDGLDKVPAVRARLLFAESSLLRESMCALIYAAPIEFYYRVAAWQANNIFDDYLMLPSPPVIKRPPTGDDWQQERETATGLAIMRKVVRKRLVARDLDADKVITPEALTLLARMSGGVMRELIRSFRDAATFAQLLDRMQVDEEIAQKVIHRRRQEMGPRLTLVHRDALKLILRQGMLSGGQQEATEDELLRNLHLLSYQDNGNAWFDAHPNVLPLL
jgi:hypothetical protein